MKSKHFLNEVILEPSFLTAVVNHLEVPVLLAKTRMLSWCVSSKALSFGEWFCTTRKFATESLLNLVLWCWRHSLNDMLTALAQIHIFDNSQIRLESSLVCGAFSFNDFSWFVILVNLFEGSFLQKTILVFTNLDIILTLSMYLKNILTWQQIWISSCS